MLIALLLVAAAVFLFFAHLIFIIAWNCLRMATDPNAAVDSRTQFVACAFMVALGLVLDLAAFALVFYAGMLAGGGA